MQINKSRLFEKFFDKFSENGGKRQIKYLVLHHIAAANFDLAIKDLLNHQVSSHYIINYSGEIFQLVEEENIAWHAGHSFWHSCEGLNQSSIGIEFYNPDPFSKKFSETQIEAGIIICQEIIKKYNIAPINVVGHSDIAYFADDAQNRQKNIVGHLGRKDDPSVLFPWKKFAANGIGLWAEDNLTQNQDQILLRLNDKNAQVKILKEKLHNFGYKIAVIDEVFDPQLASAVLVFNQRFCGKNSIINWNCQAETILNKLLNFI